MPKRVKYRKAQRGRMKGTAQRGATLAFGAYGLKALEPGWVTNRQIEAARVALSRSLWRGARGARSRSVGDEGEQVARSLRRGAHAEGARARRGDLYAAVPALDGRGQEPVAAGPGPEESRAGLHGAPREEGVAAWASARPGKAWW